jgi:hypothetical protein
MVTTVGQSTRRQQAGQLSRPAAAADGMGTHACWSGALRTDRLPRCHSGMRHHAELDNVELAEEPPARRVRATAPNDVSPIGEHGDVGDRGRAVGDRQARSTRIRPGACRDRDRRIPAKASDRCPVTVVLTATTASKPGPACDTTPSPIRGAVILGSVVGPCTSKQPLHPVDSRHQQLSFFWRQGTFVSLPDYTPLRRDRANRIHLVRRGRARGRRITPVVTVAYSLG